MEFFGYQAIGPPFPPIGRPSGVRKLFASPSERQPSESTSNHHPNEGTKDNVVESNVDEIGDRSFEETK